MRKNSVNKFLRLGVKVKFYPFPYQVYKGIEYSKKLNFYH